MRSNSLLTFSRLLAEDKNSFLVVVRDKPPSLNKTLKTILSNWTYLKWPDLPEEKEEFYLKLKSSILKSKSNNSRLRF